MKECDEVSYGPGAANEYSACSAICGSVSGCLGNSWQSASRRLKLTPDRQTESPR